MNKKTTQSNNNISGVHTISKIWNSNLRLHWNIELIDDLPTDCIDDFYGTNCMIAYHGVFLEYIQRCSDREVLVMDEKDNMRQRCLYHMIS